MIRSKQLGLGLFALLALAPAGAGASVLKASYTRPSCDHGLYVHCRDTSFLSTQIAGAGDAFIGSPSVGGSLATFTSAFDAWNAANGGVWTLRDGGVLDVTINPYVSVNTNDTAGGLFPVLFTLTGGDPAALANLSWTQAIVTNTSPVEGPLRPPVQTLDTFSFSQDAQGSNPNFPKTCSPAAAGASPKNGAFCGPIYPFQYAATLSGDTLNGIPLGASPFIDGPSGPWPDASFTAITLLSSVSADTLTVYQGVSYGYALTVNAIPEPSTWALAICGLVGLGLARRLRRAG